MTNEFTKLAERIHEITVAHGFWEAGAERDFEEMLALANSELSEAVEEDRSGHPLEYFQINGQRVQRVVDGSGADWTTDEDGLTESLNPFVQTWTDVPAKPCGTLVELADFVIRIFDICYGRGFRAFDEQMGYATHFKMSDNFAANTFRISEHLHHALDYLAPGSFSVRAPTNWHLMTAVRKTFMLAHRLGCEDFLAVIVRKVDYNATRPFLHGGVY